MDKKTADDNRLDKINTERVEMTKQRVAHAIKLLNNPVNCLSEGHKIDNAETIIAKAVNLLEAANEEMQWACDHFKWNDEVCIQIDTACGKLGITLAILTAKDDEDYDIEIAGYEGQDALNILSKAIATLIRWFADDLDATEV